MSDLEVKFAVPAQIPAKGKHKGHCFFYQWPWCSNVRGVRVCCGPLAREYFEQTCSIETMFMSMDKPQARGGRMLLGKIRVPVKLFDLCFGETKRGHGVVVEPKAWERLCLTHATLPFSSRHRLIPLAKVFQTTELFWRGEMKVDTTLNYSLAFRCQSYPSLEEACATDFVAALHHRRRRKQRGPVIKNHAHGDSQQVCPRTPRMEECAVSLLQLSEDSSLK